MDRPGAFPPDCRPTLESGTRTRAGLVVGRSLLLRNVLVARVSNDPLCAHFCSIGLSAFTVAYCIGRAVPCSLQLDAVSTCRSNWSRRTPGGADLMGYERMGSLRSNRPIMECDWLFAGISPFADSGGTVGWCLCR